MKWTVELMKEYVQQFDYEFYPTSTTKTLDKVLFKCKAGHEYLSSFRNFKDGNRCKQCWTEKRKEISFKFRKMKS